MFRIKLIFICTALLFSTIAEADWVTPAERVKQGISLREGPSANSRYLGQLGVCQRLALIRSVPYWHEVQQADGTPAFVSKSWSTIIPDDASASTTTTPFTIDVIDVKGGWPFSYREVILPYCMTVAVTMIWQQAQTID